MNQTKMTINAKAHNPIRFVIKSEADGKGFDLGNERNSNTLFFKRGKVKRSIKITKTLSAIYFQKSQDKRDQLLKTRREKLQSFRINYIPLCSDEDWEAMAAFYKKNSEK